MGDLKSEIHSIKLPGNDTVFLLFNTDTHLYLLNENGHFADKFPMRFPLNATNGITVIENGRNRDLSILVAFQDHRVYHFTLDGLSMENWQRPNINEEIIRPIEYQKINGSDFLFISGSKGNAMIVDGTGTTLVGLGSKFRHSPNSGFYPNRTSRKGILLTTDPFGKVLFIQENGRTSEVTLNLFSQAHRFFYEDITGTGQLEFIFTDKNRIDYYNRNYKLLYSYAFRREITVPPFLIRIPDNKVMIGFVAPETNELYLFNQNGNKELESGIRGNTPFDIGHLMNQVQLNLVVGYGKYLRNYRLPKF
jgi:hypothetical protein